MQIQTLFYSTDFRNPSYSNQPKIPTVKYVLSFMTAHKHPSSSPLSFFFILFHIFKKMSIKDLIVIK